MQLTGNPASGYSFSYWSGDASGSANPTTITMSSNKSITVHFTPEEEGRLYLAPTDSGASYCNTTEVEIRVNTVDDGIEINGGAVVLTYDSGCADVIAVEFDPMWAVTGWDSDTPGQETVGFMIAAEDQQPDDYLVVTLTIHCVNDSPEGCLTDLIFAEGTMLTNIAGDEIYPEVENGSFQCEIVQCYGLSTNISPSGSGTVSADPEPNCPSDPGKYLEDTEVQLTANPASGYSFSYWSGDASGSTNPTTVTMNSNKSITGHFTPEEEGRLYLDPTNSGASYCSTTEVEIRVNTVDDGIEINGGAVVLTYDSGCADVTSVEFDPMWAVTGWDSDTPGQEAVGFMIPAEDQQPDDYLVATLTIHCENDSPEGCLTDLILAEGTMLTNIAGDEIYPEVENGSFQCGKSADLAISKADDPDPIIPGNPLTYTIAVTNTGPSDATGVIVTDTLPLTVTFASSSASQGTCNGTSTVTCTLGTISNGASATMTIVVTPTASGTFTNTASVTSGVTDPNMTNNSATATTTACYDFNGDGRVGIEDIMAVASHWRCKCGDACYDPLYDLDGDCDIDVVDIMLVVKHWGETCACRDNYDCLPGFYCYKTDCVTPTGECSWMPDYCTWLYAPICGCDGVTYSNDCFAAGAGVNIDCGGECPCP